ncbi:carboxypeptidase-like regulatory domain-containing protein, partial [Porphyromonas levii]
MFVFMTKRFLLLLISCLFISALSPAQISIQGKVQDEFYQNLPSTTVRLLTTDSLLIKGTYTNQYGEFVFSEISSGNYLLCCSFLGYQLRYVSISVNQKDTVIPPIQLLPTSHELSEVFVEAPSYIRKSDRVLVIPKQNQIAHASTGYDLLYNLMIPGISVDQRKGSVSSFGRSVTLYINGRKADSREIKNIRSKDILNVQYHDVPTGKYSGDFASINIVTKDYDQGGYVAIDGKQTIGFKRGDYNLAAKKSAGNWDFTFFAGYQMEDHSGISEAREETFHFQERNITRRSQTLDSHFKQDQQYYQFFISHIRDKRTLLGRISLFANATPINHQIRENIYANTSIKKQIEDLNSNQKSLMPELYLYGSFNITEKQTLDLSFRGNYARNNYERDYTEG